MNALHLFIWLYLLPIVYVWVMFKVWTSSVLPGSYASHELKKVAKGMQFCFKPKHFIPGFSLYHAALISVIMAMDILIILAGARNDPK